MFIEINNREDLLSKLKELKNEEIAIHYNCSQCDDEQVTNEMQVTDIINEIENKNEIMTRLECTNCGSVELWIRVGFIQGIETNF